MNNKSNQKLNPYLAIELSIVQERLRQARNSANLAFVMTAASAIIGFVGVGLLWSGKASEGVVATSGGIVSSVRCFQLAKDANDRLDQILKQLKDNVQLL